MENPIEMERYLVTCQTENCGNAGFQIEVVGNKTDPVVVCGVCDIQIIDLIVKTSK